MTNPDLLLLLDDHSGLIVAVQYHRTFHLSFMEALKRRGLPRKLNTDQGRLFTDLSDLNGQLATWLQTVAPGRCGSQQPTLNSPNYDQP